MAISPWHDEAKQDSPDGRFVAVYDRAMEIAMGGPTVGRLIIKAKNNNARIAEFPDANGSFVWAVDSSALAFPRARVDAAETNYQPPSTVRTNLRRQSARLPHRTAGTTLVAAASCHP